MKKQILVIILLAILVVSCLALTACHSCEFGEWEVTKQPTCTQDGSKERVCECGEKETEVVTATGHSYAAVVTDPTCLEQGYTTHTCATCGDVYVDAYINALGHDTVEHDAQAPTCTNVGWSEYITCSRCSYTTYQEISAIGHSYESVLTTPTCTQKGFTTHTCSVCGDTYMDAQVDATGHNFQEADSCAYCQENIVDVAIEVYDMSKTTTDSVKGYIIVRPDKKHDIYVKGVGAMKDYGVNSPFWNSGYSLVDVYIGNDITSIGNNAFNDCGNATVTFQQDSKLYSIGDGAFESCFKLKSITIPNSVVLIGRYAFFDCTQLGNVTLSSSLQSIGVSAFDNCYSLASITIPSSVVFIGEDAFLGCSNLTSAVFEDVNFWYVFKAADETNVTNLILTDIEQNATYLKTTYSNYYWYRSNQ